MKAAEVADHFHELRRAKLAQTKDADQFLLAKELFQS